MINAQFDAEKSVEKEMFATINDSYISQMKILQFVHRPVELHWEHVLG